MERLLMTNPIMQPPKTGICLCRKNVAIDDAALPSKTRSTYDNAPQR
jgi:hypothetical protein